MDNVAPPAVGGTGTTPQQPIGNAPPPVAGGVPPTDSYPNPFVPPGDGGSQAELDDQAYYDGICQSDPEFGAAYLAAKDANNEWACVLKPVPTKPQPCFGERYTDPKTSKPGCCPRGKPFSFNAVSKNGACCDTGKTYQETAATTQAGVCCLKGNIFTCACKDGGSYVDDPLSCPRLHRNIRISPNGPRFNLLCNTSTKRKDIKIAPAASFIDCVDACGGLAGCAGVEFNKLTKQCSFKSEYLTETSEIADNNDVDSAFMDAPPQCPGAEGKIVSVGGVDYQLYCMNGWSTSLPTSKSTKANDIYDCTRQCTDLGSKCQGANYWVASKDCIMTSAFEYPPTASSAAANALIAAIPTKVK